MDTRARVIRVVETVAVKRIPFAPEDSLLKAGVLDSFAFPELIAGLEAEFGIEVGDADLVPERFDSVALIEAYLREHV